MKYTKDNPMVAYGEDYYRAKHEGIPVVHGLSMAEQAEKDAHEISERNRIVSEDNKLKSDVAKIKSMLEKLLGEDKEEPKETPKEEPKQKRKGTTEIMKAFQNSNIIKDFVNTQPYIK